MNTSFSANNANSIAMNTSSIDALADVALKSEMPSVLRYPSSLSSSSSLLASQNSSSTKLASASDPNNLMTAMSNSRFSSFPMVPMPSSSMPMSQGLPNRSDGNPDHSIYLSILNEQRRRSMTDLNSSGAQAMTVPSTAGIVRSDTAESTIPSQASGVSAASNYASMMQTQFESTITAPSRRRKPNFAEKLHAVLSNKDSRHAIAWLPSGRSFCITDQDEFVKKILPKFFREAKFESFSRRLKRWGFRKVYTTGLSQIIFSHDLFHRDRPDLCKIMNGREKVTNSGDFTTECTQGMAPSDGVDSFASQNQFRNAMLLQQAQQQHHQAAFQAMQQMNQQRAKLAAQGTQQVPAVSAGSSPRNSFLSQNPVALSLRGTSTSPAGSLSGIDARAILNEASALVSRSMPSVAKNPQAVMNVNDPGTIQEAKMQLTKLNDDIANCEEQLVILQQLKELKERRRLLTGNASPSGISSPSV